MSNTYATIMTIPRMEEIVETHKGKTPFRQYASYDVANSYKYMGAKMTHDGRDYYFTSRNLAIFFFILHDDIQQDERNTILELFTTGYQKGYSEVEGIITEKLGLQERSHDNIQAIACKMYVESYKKYDNWLFSAIDRFYNAGYNQGQLHKLKVMMEGLDVVDARNERIKKESSDKLPSISSSTSCKPNIELFATNFIPKRDDWWNNLIIDIEANLKSGKGGYTIVAMAKVIYDSGKLHHSMKPKKFAPWLKLFCEAWGITNIPTSKAGNNGVKSEIARINHAFWYLSTSIPK